MALYRVEKDGITFYIQPEQLGYYADAGWTVYKTVEEAVGDVSAELASQEANVVSGSAECSPAGEGEADE